MALLPRSSLLLPSPLGDYSFPSSAPLPSLCPNPCGEHASHLSPCGVTRAFIPVQRVSRQKEMHPSTEVISLWEEGKSCLISHTGWLPALQRDGQGYGLVLGLAGSETHHEPQEQKTCSPCSSLAWQLVCPGLHRCFLLAGPAHSGIARVTPLSAAPPHFLPLLARHMASPDSPCGATRAHPEFSHTLHMEAGSKSTQLNPSRFTVST